MQTWDEVEGLHNCQEFSQSLECLYQAMQTKEKKIFKLLLYDKPPEKKRKLFVTVLIKREILTSHQVLYTKSCTRNQFLFCKKMLSKNIQIFLT